MDVVPDHALRIDDSAQRARLLRALAAVPGLLEPLRKFVSEPGFQVVMSEGNAHLFKADAAGTYKPFLREGGRFVENVHLEKLPFDYAGLIASVASQAQMAAIMHKLDAIAADVKRSGDEARDKSRAEVEGRVASLRVARELRHENERRSRMLSACDDLVTALTVLAGQLRSSIAAMPSEKNGLLDGWFGDKLATAEAAFRDVAADITAVRSGCLAVLEAYADLDERAAARAAFEQFITVLAKCDLDGLGRRAGLVLPSIGATPARVQVGYFREGIAALQREILHPAMMPSVITIDISPSDLGRPT